MKTNNLMKLIIAILLTIVFSQAISAEQITDNKFLGYKPSLYDSTIAWFGYSSRESDATEIYYYDGNKITQITNNNLNESRPMLYDGIITWEADDDIYYWDGSTHRLTNDTNSDSEPCVYNGAIAWISYIRDTDTPLENGYDILLWDGITTTQITNTKTQKYDLSYHNGEMVWIENDGNDDEIFYYDGINTIQITSNDFGDDAPKIHNGIVVWYGGSSSIGYEIYYYDGSIHKLTDDEDAIDTYPTIYDGNIAWKRTPMDGEDGIYYYDSRSETITQVVSLEEGGGGSPSLWEYQVACEGLDLENINLAANGFEIFLHDINASDSSINSDSSGSGGSGCFIGCSLPYLRSK